MKTILLAGAVTLSVFSMQAQTRKHHDHNQGGASFGLKGGLNIADVHLHNTESNNVDAKASFYAGGLAHIHLNETFALQPEIMYSNQGYKYTNTNTTTRVNLHYINVPVLAQVMVGDGFRIETGPQLGVLVAARQKTSNLSVDVKDRLKPIDFSWAFGLGYITHSGFGVDARYNVGINNINDVANTGTIKNRVFQAGVFYQFNTH